MDPSGRLRTVLGHLQKNNCSASIAPLVGSSLAQDGGLRYSRNNSILSYEQRQFYEENGYILIKKLVSDQILDMCRDHFIDICDGVCPHDGMFLMREPTLLKAGATGERLFYKIQDILYDDYFSQYTSCPQLLDYVAAFTGPNITAIHSMLINKPPDAQETTIHPLHQDLLYFPFRPADLIVGVWTAMERVDTENGCLVVLPGTHKRGELLSHGTESFQTGPYKTFLGVKGMQNERPIPLVMEKGDTVLFHPLLIHGSGPNKSKRFRKAISCHYASSDCHVIDIQNTPHLDVAKSIESTAMKGTGMPIDFATVMKMRSKHLRGQEGFTAL